MSCNLARQQTISFAADTVIALGSSASNTIATSSSRGQGFAGVSSALAGCRRGAWDGTKFVFVTSSAAARIGIRTVEDTYGLP